MQLYQENEACVCDWYSIIVKGYAVLAKITHDHNKLWVISPYLDLNIDQCNSNIPKHKDGFKAMARAGADIIGTVLQCRIHDAAIQEGRGCGKGPYYWNYQINNTVNSVDPRLDKIVHYTAPNRKAGGTYRDIFTGSLQQAYKTFEDARVELKQQVCMP